MVKEKTDVLEDFNPPGKHGEAAYPACYVCAWQCCDVSKSMESSE